MRRMIIFLLLLVGVMACGATADQPKSVLIGDLFTVVVGETVVIPSENLAITFDNVLEDSPLSVTSGVCRDGTSARCGDGATRRR